MTDIQNASAYIVQNGKAYKVIDINSWNDLTDKPFYDAVTESINIEHDGDNTGKVIFTFSGMDFARMSDATVTNISDILEAHVVGMGEGISMEMPITPSMWVDATSDLGKSTFVAMFNNIPFIAILNEDINETYKKGIYVISMPEMYVTSFTCTIQHQAGKKLDPKYLPEGGFGYEEVKHIGGDTLTWDGSPTDITLGNTGRDWEIIDCLVSGKVPTIDQVRSGTLKIYNIESGMHEVDISSVSDFETYEYDTYYVITNGDLSITVALVDGATTASGSETYPKKGIYFSSWVMKGVYVLYISELTIPGFDFAESEIHKIDKKFLPDDIGGLPPVTEADNGKSLIVQDGEWIVGESDANLYVETDPTVPAWAKASTKPVYTADEVGAAAVGHNHDTVYESKTDAQAKLNEAKAYTDTGISDLESGFVDVLVGMYGDDAPAEGNPPTIRQIANDEANTALSSAKSYADSATAAVKNDLLNGAGGAYDTLKELGDLIDDNKDAIDALETVASGKADKIHSHEIADVSGLQSALDGKAATVHGTHVSYSGSSPLMDGVASTGGESMVARSDHRHPTDTSRASKEEFDIHTSNTTAHITADERTNWNAAKTHADTAHAPSNAEKNQNAFSNITVGSTTIAADTATDTVTFVGSNVTITPDATNDKITFAVADGSTSGKGIVQLTNSTSSTSTTTAATPSSVKSAYDLANTAKTNAETVQTNLDTHTNNKNNPHGVTLTQLGVTATAAELNYVDGVTSNIQTQLGKKAGKIVVGQSFTIDGVAVTAGTGAEIFNNYSSNKATGSYSHAEGSDTTASGNYGSHAEGRSTTASNSGSHAEGYNTTASGFCSHAEGSSYNKAANVTTSTNNAEIIAAWTTTKFSLAKGTGAHVEGDDCLALGYSSHAEGKNTIASGDDSHAEGNNTTASGHGSHAEGNKTTASYQSSHAEGSSTRKASDVTASTNNSEIITAWTTTKFSLANAPGAHVEGQDCLALGGGSHAEGICATASAYASHAEGSNTIASSGYQHVQGKYNIEKSSSYLHIVGNGTADDARSNAHTLGNDGTAWFAGDVYVGSNSGTDKDNGSKKLATEEYVDNKKFDINVEYGLRFDSATQTLYMTCNGVTVASCIIPLNQAQECGIVGSDGAYIIDINGNYIVPYKNN